MTGPRLLLLELVAGSALRDERADFFPFYKGLAESGGIPARWLCVGVDFAAGGAERAVGAPSLGRADLHALSRALAEWSPTHVIVNEELGPELQRAAAAAAPRAEFLTATADHLRPPGGEKTALDLIAKREGWGRAAPRAPEIPHERALTRFFQTAWLSDWLGLPAAGEAWFVGSVTPSYEAETLNARARELKPFLPLVGGISCDYRSDLARNPLYRDVDLSACDRAGGCAFCTPTHPPSSDLAADPLAAARVQLDAAARAGERGRALGRINVRDIRLFRRLEEFFAAVEAAGLPPSEFFFAPRVDDLLKAGPELEKLLPRLAARGHKLSLFRMGVEHFSPAENARFNKGMDAERVDRGLALAERLKAEHPAAFDYAKPLGYIAFTPWTTLEDLSITLREAMKRGFDPQGPWLYSALELAESSPIAALARRDGGMLSAGYGDAALTYSMAADSRSRPGLLPWRIKDPAAAAACRIIVRVCALSLRGIMPDDVFAGDKLYVWLKGLADGRGLDLKRPDLFAAELVTLMKSEGAPKDEKALVLKTLERARGPQERPAKEPAAKPSDAARKAWRLFLDAVDADFEKALGVKCRSGWDGEVIAVSFGGKSIPLLLVPKSSPCPAFYAQTPSFSVCIRGKTRMSPQEQGRLKIYLEALSRRDRVLAGLPRGAAPSSRQNAVSAASTAHVDASASAGKDSAKTHSGSAAGRSAKPAGSSARPKSRRSRRGSTASARTRLDE